MTNDQQGSTPPTPPNQPDLGKAAKDLWTAAKTKAKELGGKAAETAKDVGAKAATAAKDVGAKAAQQAKDLQATSQPSKDPTSPASSIKDKALDVWRRAPTLVVVCGLGLLLCSSCCVCTGLFSLLSGSRGTPMANSHETPSKAGTSGKDPKRNARSDKGELTVEINKNFQTMELAAWKIAEEVYRAATKRPELTTLKVKVVLSAFGGFKDRYGNPIGATLEMGSFDVSDLDDVRKFRNADTYRYDEYNVARYTTELERLEYSHLIER